VRVFQITDPHDWDPVPEAQPSVSPVLALVGFMGLCLLLGAVDAALMSGPARAWYLSLTRPAGAMPDAVFLPVWGGIYLMEACAAWLVWCQAGASSALQLWGWNIGATALRAAALFGLRSPVIALALCVISGLLLAAVVVAFGRIRSLAGWLMVPSLLWSGYLVYLNAGFVQLNPS
jgi:benzodiazapine receptor